MNNSYLIPANSKRSMLLFGIFKPFDLGLFAIGSSISLLLLTILPLTSTALTLIVIAPGLVTGFLVLPIPNYYNVRTFIKSVWTFYTTRQKFIWKGWCFSNGQNSEK